MDPAASRASKAIKRMKLHMAHTFIMGCRLLPGAFHKNAAELGQSLEFSLWIKRVFGAGASVPTRDRLWKRMIEGFDPDAKVVGFEYGVAYGHATRWWLAHCPNLKTWYGFDTFTGLPEAWRHFPAGAFNADGKHPDIADSRVEWVVGRVEDTCSGDRVSASESDSEHNIQRVFILDLDLYKPMQYVLNVIFPRLREGDILYFDEAADWDERRALLEAMESRSVSLKLIGATPMAIALQVAAEQKES